MFFASCYLEYQLVLPDKNATQILGLRLNNRSLFHDEHNLIKKFLTVPHHIQRRIALLQREPVGYEGL